MNEKEIRDIFSDDAFVAHILSLETAEEMQQALSEQGLEMSIREIQMIQSSLKTEERELVDEELDYIAGGVVANGIGAILTSIAKTAGTLKKLAGNIRGKK